MPDRCLDSHADDDRQPRHDRRRSRAHRRAMQAGLGIAHRRHARDRHDGRDRGGAGSRDVAAIGQDHRADRRDGSVRVWQLGRLVQSRQRAVVRADAAGRRVPRDERTVLPMGSREKKQRDRSVRGDMSNSPPRGTRRTRRMNPLLYKKVCPSVSSVSSVVVIFFVSFVSFVFAQRSMRTQTVDEATRLLQEYVRIDTSNPPGDTRKAADFLAGIFQRDGIRVERYESAPGKAILYARLKTTLSPPAGKPIVLLHHMDVVPADRSQWSTDPFTPVITDAERGVGVPAEPNRGAGAPGVNNVLWGRGAMDMKGQAIAQLLAFLRLKREDVPLNRDVILLAHPDEEVGGAMGARWMIANHYAELDPEYVLDEGGFGSRDVLASGKLVYGIAVAEKKLVWLKVRAEGVAGHGSQPHDQNPNDRLAKALARLLAEPDPDVARGLSRATATARSPASQPSVLQTMQARVGTL